MDKIYKKQLFDSFVKDMRDRLETGTKKYGDHMSVSSKETAMREVYEELCDVANHAFLLYLRQLEMMEKGKIK